MDSLLGFGAVAFGKRDPGEPAKRIAHDPRLGSAVKLTRRQREQRSRHREVTHRVVNMAEDHARVRVQAREVMIARENDRPEQRVMRSRQIAM